MSPPSSAGCAACRTPWTTDERRTRPASGAAGPPEAILPLPFLQNGVAQVAFVVRDLDRTVEAYWTVFGIGPWHFYTYGPPLVTHMTYHGRPVEYRMRARPLVLRADTHRAHRAG